MYTLDQQTWNNVETKTGFDETIRKKINQIDTEGDGVVEKALADDQGNIISETYVSKLEAPKWKVYKALLTQSGADAPVARVLNQDEPDYLGDIVWNRSSIGNYTFSLSGFTDHLSLVSISIGEGQYSGGKVNTVLSIEDSTIEELFLYTRVANELSNPTDMGLLNTPIEIKVRQRGASPILLSAETNEDGTQIILTFDKKMSLYGADDYTSKINLSGTDADVTSGTVIVDNTITINLNQSVLSTDDLLIGSDEVSFESFDYGLLQPFSDFPAVNNVVAS